MSVGHDHCPLPRILLNQHLICTIIKLTQFYQATSVIYNTIGKSLEDYMNAKYSSFKLGYRIIKYIKSI